MSLTVYTLHLNPIHLENCDKYEAAESIYKTMMHEGMNLFDLLSIVSLPEELIQEIGKLIKGSKDNISSMKSIWD